MPLDRAHVTIASRVMLPTYAEFAFIVGLGWIFTPRHQLLLSPSLRYADELVPIQYWGGVFIIISAALALAMRLHKRRPYQIALALLLVWLVVWMVILVISALKGQSSFSAWAWAYLPVRACWASLLSLERREV